MAKARSPSYPAIGLKEAIDQVQEIYKQDYQNPIPRAVVAQHMGYTGLNGKSLGVLSALLKYGLLEGRGDDTRVSDAGVVIVAHPIGSRERFEAVKAAASKPELFAELDNRFPGGKASDQAIRSYLLTQKFIPPAADAVIRAYRETKNLVEAESAGYTVFETDPPPESPPVPAVPPAAPPPQPPFRPAMPTPPNVSYALAEDEPYRVSLTKSTLEVEARLRSPDDVDALINALNAWKLLFKKADDIKPPPEAHRRSDLEGLSFFAGHAAPQSGVYQVHHMGHMPGQGEGQIQLRAGEKFPPCHLCAGAPVKYTIA